MPRAGGLVSLLHATGGSHMNRTQLGRTGIEVSAFCLGTMTYGTNTNEQESHSSSTPA